MYESFFGLKRRPFLAVPDTESYCSIDQMESAQQAIERIVRRGEGLSLIIGPSGIGKTLLLRLLRKSLDPEYTVATIANGRLESAKAFFQQLLYELRLPFSHAEENELRLMLMDFARQETTPGIVLLFDEAQYLDHSVLEEIRLLMNCDDGAMPFFRAVLAGTVEFEEKLTHPKLVAFNQRIVSRHYLETMTRDETCQYIAWQTRHSRSQDDKQDISEGLSEFIRNSGQLESFGGEVRRIDAPHTGLPDAIFTDDAKRRIYQLTEGLPRLINQLCDQSLQLAAEKVSRDVDEALIQKAWAQLQQIEEDVYRPETHNVSTIQTETHENIDEIVARKKVSFRLKEFGSCVQFGTLDEEPAAKSCGIAFVSAVDQYKPPYPVDDEEDDCFAISEENAVTEIRLPVDTSESDQDLFDDDFSKENNPVARIDIEVTSKNEDEAESEQESATDDLKTETQDIETEVLDENISFENISDDEDFVAKENDSASESQDLEGESDKNVEAPTVADSLRYPVRRENRRWAGPRRYQERKKPELQPDVFMFQPTFAHLGSLSLTCRVFEQTGGWIGNVATRILYLPAVWVATSNVATKTDSQTTKTVDEDPIVAQFDTPDKNGYEETFEEQTETVFAIDDYEEKCDETCEEEAPMDDETLKLYGVEVLEGRPPFVRQEPNYAYQTTDYTPEPPLRNGAGLPYPDPATGNLIELKWNAPKATDLAGTGTAYRSFVERSNDPEANDRAARCRPVDSQLESLAEFEASRVVRAVMNEDAATLAAAKIFAGSTGFEEAFDEIVPVEKASVSLAEIYRSQTTQTEETTASRVEIIQAVNAIVQQSQACIKIEDVARQLSDAAAKIEQAASISTQAGMQLKQSAEFVDTEIKTALPTFQDMFLEFSAFQQTVSHEMQTLRSDFKDYVEQKPISLEQVAREFAEFSEQGESNASPNNLLQQKVLQVEQSQKLLPFPKRPDFAPGQAMKNTSQMTTEIENQATSSNISDADGLSDFHTQSQ